MHVKVLQKKCIYRKCVARKFGFVYLRFDPLRRPIASKQLNSLTTIDALS